jgi:hypothetical protein
VLSINGMLIQIKRLRWSALLAIGLVPLVAESQTPTGVVAGIVTGLNNSPVSGVSVSLGRYSSQTNAEGRFTISRVPLGTYEVSMQKDGFVRVPYPAPRITVTLSKEQPTAGLRVAMAPPYGFSGRVLDEGGNPVSSVDISLMRETYNSSGVRWLTAVVGAKVSTNANGEYRFTNIAPGEYYMVAMPGRGNLRFVNSFYPGVASPENATPIRAFPGTREDHFDFSLVRGAMFSVRLTAPPPAIVSPGVIPSFSLLPAGRGRLLTSFTVETMFESAGGNVYVSPPVPPGNYMLDVVWATQNRVRVAVEIVDRNVDLGTVIPKDPLTITGRFGAYGLTDVRSFSLENLDPETGSISGPSRSRDGTFRWDWVPEGRYVIAPTPSLQRQKGFIASVKLGGREVTEDVFELNEGSSKNLEIAVGSASGGSIYGVLQDSKGVGVSFGRVVLVPAPERRGNPYQFLTTMSDASGAFRIDAIPPGDYEVFGWDYVEENAYLNAAFLRKFDGRSTLIRVQPRSTSRFLVNAIEGAR